MDCGILIKTIVSPALGTNSYLVYEKKGGEAVIVDAGYKVAGNIGKTVQANRLAVTTLVNTHGHFDHIEDNIELKEMFGLVIAASRKDEGFFEDPESLGFPLPFPVKPSGIDVNLDSKSAIKIGKFSFSVLETPGHTKGSICLYEKNAGVLFSGDTLFAGCCGRTDLKGGDEGEMRESLSRLASLPKRTVVYPGHGEPTTIGNERGWMARF